MTPLFNPAVRDQSGPPIPAVQNWASTYDLGSGPVLDFSQAVPGYPPHSDLLGWLGVAAASTALTGYGDIEGEPILRSAYAAHVSTLYDCSVASADVQITSGCNQAFFATMMAIAGPGDSVALISPFYFNHQLTLDLLGVDITAIEARAADGFIPDPDVIAGAINSKTKAVVLVSPNNPTGAIYPDALLKAIFDICHAHGVWLVIDETYRDFLPNAAASPHGLLREQHWRETCIQLYSFSKSYCIPGHRLGAITADAGVISQVVKIMDNLQICAPRPAQHAVAQAIPALGEWREINRAEMADRAKAFRSIIARQATWKLESLGGYFAYIRHPFGDLDAVTVAERFASDHGVITLPGPYFGEGQQPFLRLAFANVDVPTIESFAERLDNFQIGGN